MRHETQQFILQLLHEGREWAKLLLPALLTWHLPAPRYMKRDTPPAEAGPRFKEE